MQPRRYFQLVEKESKDISLIWKGLHALIFFLLVVNSIIAAHTFNDIFDTFNYRCILYSKPYFILRTVEYKQRNVTEITKTVTANVTPIVLETSTALNITPQALIVANGDGDDDDAILVVENVKRMKKRTTHNWLPSQKIPGSVNAYIVDNEIWVNNKILSGQVHIRMMKTVFATLLTCDYVLFVPLFSIAVACVFVTIVLVCGRGGKGYASDTVPEPWRYVYLILVASTVMAVLSLVAFNMADNGLKAFCKRFELFTGKKECNQYINYFTVEQKLGYRLFWEDYTVTHYTYMIEIFLWIAQLIVTCLRVLTMTDFQFQTILVKLRKKHDTLDEEDDNEFQKVHQALSKLNYDVVADPEPFVDDEDSFEDNTESTTQV